MTLRKILSLILAVLMLTSLFAVMLPTTAFADDDDEEESERLYEDVESISYKPANEYKIFENSNGRFVDDEDRTFYQYNEPFFADGDVLTLNCDGYSVDFVFTRDGWYFESEDGEYLNMYDDVNAESDQMDNPWVLGSENYFDIVLWDEFRCTLSVTIIKNPVEAFAYIHEGDVVFYEENGGEWTVDEDDKDFYEYRLGFYNGDIARVTYNDGRGTVDYTYRYNDEIGRDAFVSESGDVLTDDDVRINHEQWQKHWQKGAQSYTVEYAGKTVTVPVTVKDVPVKKLTYTHNGDITYFENTNGELRDDDEDDVFWEYNLGFYEGDVLTVEYTDERGTVDYCFTRNEETREEMLQSKDGDILKWYEGDAFFLESDQYETHWEVGENSYRISYYGVTTEVKVQVLANPVKSISFTPNRERVLLKDTEGEWQTDASGIPFFEYNTGWFEDNDILTVEYTDNRGRVDYYFTRNESGEYFEIGSGGTISVKDIDWFADQWENHWYPDSKNYITLKYMGFEAKIPVSIIDNPVKSISYIPAAEEIVFYENAGGEWRDDGEGGEYYEYHPRYEWDDILRVEYVDSNKGTVDYKYTWLEEEQRGVFLSKDGEEIEDRDVRIEYDQWDNHWQRGNVEYEVVYSGMHAKVNAELKENPVQSITITQDPPIVVPEKTSGEWRYDQSGERYWNYRIRIGEGLSVTVKYKDGRADETYTYNAETDCFHTGGEEDNILTWDDFNGDTYQDDVHWTMGSENKITVEYMGAVDYIYVTIVEDETDYTGTTGDCSWSFDKESQVLTISGKGAMADYDRDHVAPWSEFSIELVKIESGVTAIGSDAFCFTSTSEVSIADTVTSIGNNAFNGCPSIREIFLPEGVKTIGAYAFFQASAEYVYIPTGVSGIGERAFGFYYDNHIDDDRVIPGFEIQADKNTKGQAYAILNDVTFVAIHDYDDGVVTLEPDYDREGENTFTCKHCGEKDVRPIAKLPKTDLSGFKVSGVKDVSYTGKALTLKLTVKNGSKKLVAGADYTVTYKNNKKVGKATLTITGIKAYEGTIKKTFKIVKAKNPITAKGSTKNVKLKDVTKKKTVTVKKSITVKNAKGKVSYKLASVPKALKKLTKIDAKGTITIKKWAKAKKGTYIIKVKVSAKGDSSYKSGSADVTVKIKIK